jgi:predicted DNA-binding protein with PD1-like motif
MQSTEGKIGRVFILRLEDGDMVPGCIEKFAAEKNIKMAGVTLIGGIGAGQIVSGPRYTETLISRREFLKGMEPELPQTEASPLEPMLLPIDGAHEVVGIGLIVPDSKGKPNLHIHASLGRAGQAKTGCLRPGVKTWLVGEAVIYEILGASAARLPDEKTGFELLQTG